MLGTTNLTDPMALALATIRAGDKSKLYEDGCRFIDAGAAVALVNPEGKGKKPIDLRTAAMKRADVKAGAPTKADGSPLGGWHAATTSKTRLKRLLEIAGEKGIDVNIGNGVGASRLILVDLDNAGDVTSAQARWAEHGDTLPPITIRTPGQLNADGVMEHDGKGGHILLRLPDGVDQADLHPIYERLTEEQKVAQRRGGWAVIAGSGGNNGSLLPPSVRAEGIYGFTGMDIEVASGWLIDESRAAKRDRAVTDPGVDTRDAATAEWEDLTPWERLLRSRGWTPTGNTRACGCPTWRRPGKVDGESAIAHEPSCGELTKTRKVGMLYIFSDNAPVELRGEKSWSKLAFVAASDGISIPEAKARLGIRTVGEPSPTPSPTDSAWEAAEDSVWSTADTAATDGKPVDVESATVPAADDSVWGVASGDAACAEAGDSAASAEADAPANSRDDEDRPNTDNPFGVPPLHQSQLPEIESAVPGGVWNATPLMQWIARNAADNMVSAYAQMATLMSLESARIPYFVVLPTRLGDEPSSLASGGSLNFSALLIGESGKGKSDLLRRVPDLRDPGCKVVGAGTAQGWLKLYVHNETVKDETTGESRKVRVRDAHAVMLIATEIESYLADNFRSGSKTGSTSRELISGDSVSNITADKDRDTYLRAGSYRWASVVGAQVVKCAPLMTPEEVQAGSFQRHFLAPVVPDLQPRIAPGKLKVPEALWINPGPPSRPTSADLESGEVLPRPVTVPWPPAAHEFMARHRAEELKEAEKGYVPTLGMTQEERQHHIARSVVNHSVLMRLRVMVLVASLHGRTVPTDLDWNISGVLMRAHLGMLSAIWEEAQQANDHTQRVEGRSQGIRLAAADTARDAEHARLIEQIAGRVLRYLERKGPTNWSVLRKGTTRGDQRRVFKTAVDDLIEVGKVTYDGALYALAENHRNGRN